MARARIGMAMVAAFAGLLVAVSPSVPVADAQGRTTVYVGQARLTRADTDQFGMPTAPRSTTMPVKVTIGGPIRSQAGAEQNPFNLTIVGGQGTDSFSVWSAAAPLNGPMQQAWAIQKVDTGQYVGELVEMFNSTATNANTLSVAQRVYGTVIPGVAPMDVGTEMGVVLGGSDIGIVIRGSAYGPGTPFTIEIMASSS